MRSSFLALSFACLVASPALSEGQSIIVLDGSGSMWGQIDGRPKLEIAREALAAVVSSLDPSAEVGLMAYGHRTKGDCADIELVVPPGRGTADAIISAASSMKFLGKTPLSDAVRKAAEDLKFTEEAANVILITDGIETCNADPCALGTELEQSGVNFTAHVVGFGLTDEEGKAVACLAENTGGRYIKAADAASLVDALRTTVAVLEPEPAPPPPEPQNLEQNVDPVALMTEGGTEPEDKLLQDAVFTFTPVGADGTPAGDQVTIYGRSQGALPPGRYLMNTTLHEARAEQIVEIGPQSEMSMPTAVLDAGILDLKIRSAANADPDPDALWEMRGANDLRGWGYGSGYRVVTSGEHELKIKLGAIEKTVSVVIEPGKTTVQDVILGAGVAVIDAYYTDDMRIEGGTHAVEILEAKTDLDGNRKSVGHTYGAGAQFDLVAGDYIAAVELHAARAEVPFSVKAGERNTVKVVLNAGVLAFSAPGASMIEVFTAKTDLNGNRRSMSYDYAESINKTFPEGDYVVIVTRADQKSEVNVTVKRGERTEIAVP